MLAIFVGIIVFSVSLYFLVLFILNKKNIGNIKNRKFIAFVPTIIMLPVIYTIVIFISFFSMTYYPKEEFDQVKWQENIEERYRMSNHIIKNDILIGKTKEQIVELLGDDFYKRENNSIGYYLGFVVGIDPDVLVIYFEDNIVVRVKRITT